MAKKGAKVMMRISASNKKDLQKGVTLFELLIVLALIAIITTISGANIRGGSNQRMIMAAAQQMRADLIQARAEADAINAPIAIHLREFDYSIPDLNISRTLPRNMQIRYGENNVIIIGPGSWLREYEILLTQGNADATIVIAPLTRRIEITNA